MTPEETPQEPDLMKKDDEIDPADDPSLGVDWGSKIEPGPGPDPRVIKPRRDADGRSIAV